MSRLGLGKYTVKEGDTIQNVAKNRLGDSTLWYELAIFNKLDYPYIHDVDQTLYSEGYVTFYRDPEEADTDILIPSGTYVSTDEEVTRHRRFEVTNSITLVEGKQYIDVRVRSLETGINGEASKGQINILESGITGISSVINKEPIYTTSFVTHAAGLVTFQRRSGVSGDILIPAGSKVATKFSIDTKTQVRTYSTLESLLIPDGQETGDTLVRCTQSGVIGNISSSKIEVQVDTITDTSGNSLIDKVTNKEPFSNGIKRNVVKAGDALLIPQGLGGDTLTDPNIQELDSDRILYGEDLFLTEDGDLDVDQTGDLKSISGIDNLTQAIRDLLKTPQGSLFYHPEYGHRMNDFVGVGSTFDQLNSLKAEIKRVMLSDPRVESVGSIVAGYHGGTATIDIDVNIIGSGTTERLSFITKE